MHNHNAVLSGRGVKRNKRREREKKGGGEKGIKNVV